LQQAQAAAPQSGNLRAGVFACGERLRWHGGGMSTKIEIHDVADLAIAYLNQDRAFIRLKSIMQAMHPWTLYGFEQDGETDAFHMSFADGGSEINFLSDGSGCIYVKRSGDKKWNVETASRNSMPIHEIISTITNIKRRLTTNVPT
jgi:hypothetical protein